MLHRYLDVWVQECCTWCCQRVVSVLWRVLIESTVLHQAVPDQMPCETGRCGANAPEKQGRKLHEMLSDAISGHATDRVGNRGNMVERVLAR